MLDIELQTVSSGYDRKTCWVHARLGVIPGNPPIVVITMSKMRLTGSDVFYSLYEMRTDDGGSTWTSPVEHADTLGRRRTEDGVDEGVANWWPAWHAKTGVLLGTGDTARYVKDDHAPGPMRCWATYSVYHPDTRTWIPWKKMEVDKFPIFCGGSQQRVDLPNGDILLPCTYSIPETARGAFYSQSVGIVARCAFDGETLRYLEHGDELTITTGRGLMEPSLAHFQGRFFLTLRNDDYGYVTSGTDGLHFDEPRVWAFDDGSDLGNYNTQQHWVTMPDALYLVYTRRGANNDHVLRHRAPLFIAQVDTDRLRVIRDTEQILVPERGARLGNFGVTRMNENESWVAVAEWMQTGPPDPYDFTVCERYGSDNSVFVAKIRFRS